MKSNEQQFLTELILRDIYDEIKYSKNKDKIQTYTIYMCDCDFPDDYEEKIAILNLLKKSKVIYSYSIKHSKEIVDFSPSEEYNDFEEVYFTKALIKLKPLTIIDYIKEISKNREKLLMSFSEYLTKMVKILRFYNKDSLLIDENINQAYLQISEDINKLLKNKLLCSFKLKYQEPFSDLFLAEKELENKNSDIDIVIKKISGLLREVRSKIFKIKIFIKGKTNVDVDDILIKIEGSNKNFKEEASITKSKKKKFVLFEFPSNTKWENITIKFISNHDVVITIKNKNYPANYEVMGFEDEKSKKPDVQWNLLRLLSYRKEVSWSNNSDLSIKKINAIKHQKKSLSDSLKLFFQINNNPFYNWNTVKAYKTKINLIPQPEVEKDELNVGEYFDELIQNT